MSSSSLYANRNARGDFVQNGIEALSDPACDINIAVAFFTEAGVINRLVERKCRIRIIVRLGFPTSPRALREIMCREGVQVRYFTSHNFHPKLYIFGDRAALVGSANLTNQAILRNQEVVVSIDAEDDRFFHLCELFDQYWNDSSAKPLDETALTTYQRLYDAFDKLDNQIALLAHDVTQRLGNTEPKTVELGGAGLDARAAYLEGFKKSYQGWFAAFSVVRKVYERHGYRKAPANRIPLRIEIDSFLSFVRERLAAGDSWSKAPMRYGEDQERFIDAAIKEWSKTYWEYFEKTIVQVQYPRLLDTFQSTQSIMDADDNKLFESLLVLHSFHDRRRFYLGGLETLKDAFFSANDSKKIRSTLNYLVFGGGDVENRMANAIFHPDHKLAEFGRSNVQELVGLINNRELPIINGRTVKVLRYFGFNVQLLGGAAERD